MASSALVVSWYPPFWVMNPTILSGFHFVKWYANCPPHEYPLIKNGIKESSWCWDSIAKESIAAITASPIPVSICILKIWAPKTAKFCPCARFWYAVSVTISLESPLLGCMNQYIPLSVSVESFIQIRKSA